MKKENKYQRAINEAYTRMYAASEPSADFNELVENAPWVDDGKNVIYKAGEVSDEQAVNEGLSKFIDYEKYFIDMDKYSEIMEDICKKYKFSKWESGNVRMWVALLGPAPTFKEKENV